MCDVRAVKQRHLKYHALTHRNGLAVEFQAQEQPVGEGNILYMAGFLEAPLKSHLRGGHLIRVTR